MKINSQKSNTKLWLGALGFALLLLATSSQSAVAQSNTFPSSGNAGIGTTSPPQPLTVSGYASSANGTTVQIVGTASSGSAQNQLNITSTANTWGLILGQNNSGVGSSVYHCANCAHIVNVNNAALVFGTNNIDRMRIDGSGNVGIGTTSPGSRLEIRNDQDAIVRMIGLNNGSSGTAAQATLSFYEGATEKAKVAVNGSGASGYVGAANALQIWHFQNAPVVIGTNSLERVRIDPSGNVGIGTTTPGSKLDVAGEIRSTTGGFRFPDGTVQTTAASGAGGGGTITGVTAGAGLTGGGTSGSVTVNNDDRGSTQYIFKNLANEAGTPQFSAGSNNDTIRFAGSGGTSVTFDAVTKKVTIDGSTSTVSAANISAGQFGQNTGGGNYTFPSNVTVNGNIAAKYQDVAEWVPATHALPAGTVAVLNPNQSNQVMAATQAYDTRVAGVISERPGIALGEAGTNKVLVATTGRVRVRVDATRAPIHIGDLLVASDKEGMAMKSQPINVGGIEIHRPGTLIGKALEPLEKGTGEILVLLSLQ